MITLPADVQWVGDIGVFVIEGVRPWDDEHARNVPTLDCDHIFCPLHGDVGRNYEHGRTTVAPEAWAQYDKPCETCEGTTTVHGVSTGPTFSDGSVPCPDCRDGRQVREIIYAPPGCVIPESARATIEVAPVVYMGRFDTGERPCVMVENASTTAAWYVPSKDGKRPFALDPRPRPGRDFVVVVRKVPR